MNIKAKFLLIVLLGSVLSCNHRHGDIKVDDNVIRTNPNFSKDDSKSDEVAKSEDNKIGKEQLQIYGKTPEDYFSQFISKVEGTCNKNIKFQYLSVANFLIGKLENGHDLKAKVDIFLHEDKTFSLKYREMDFFDNTEGIINYSITFEKTISGIWTIENDKLLIGDFAVGNGLVIDKKSVLFLTFKKNINSDGVVGKSDIAMLISSANGEETSESYCKRHN